MTQEEKAKAYDEAIERAKKWHNAPNADKIPTYANRVIEEIFPELRESEDERIRKAIVATIHLYYGEFLEDEAKEMIAWLEKQGTSYTKRDVDDAYVEGMAFAKYELKKQSEQKPYGQRQECADCQFNYAGECKGSCAMKRSEQKPTDKVEPKFKVNDWIVNNISKDVFLIKSINNGYCTLEDIKGNNISPCLPPCESESHLWTIQDAKDGDMLSDGTTIFIFKDLLSDGSVMTYCDYDIGSGESDAFCPLSVNLMCSKITPATKEQREQLEKATDDAGYAFDFEKKELKKINSYCQENCKGFQETGKCFADGECKAKREAEQEPTDEEIKTLLRTEYEKGRADAIAEMQNPAWSEEDEAKLKSACALIRNTSLNGNEGVEDFTIDWLKSLKDRVQPQPKQEWSVEDETGWTNTMIMIKEVASNHYTKDSIKLVIDWLKSLKQRYTWKPSNNEMKEALRTEYEKGRADAIAEMQKPWSEEDEQNLYLTAVAIEKEYSGELFLDKKKVKEQVGIGRKLLDWLYSFRNRVKFQPKQQWSKEDDLILETIIDHITTDKPFIASGFTDKELVTWLKSLRPQTTWKPSDEQMKALDWQVKNTYNGSWQYKSSKELLEQLKKLKGN